MWPDNRIARDAHYLYRYDRYGRLTEKTDLIPEGGIRTDDERTHRYHYDSQHRLVHYTRTQYAEPLVESRYLYDPLGRRVAKRVWRRENMDRFALRPTKAPGETLQIISVARLTEKKGLHVAIEACRQLKERGVAFHYRILGIGPWERRLRTLIEQYQLEGYVEMPGFKRGHRQLPAGQFGIKHAGKRHVFLTHTEKLKGIPFTDTGI